MQSFKDRTPEALDRAAEALDKLDRFPHLRLGFRCGQAFTSFFQFTIMSGVASHQAANGGASFLTFFDIIVGVSSFLASLCIGFIPWLYTHVDQARFLKSAAKALLITRVEFILTVFWIALWTLSVLITTIDYYTKSECKDSNAASDVQTACRNGKASVAFGWFTWILLLASLALVFKDWRAGRSSSVTAADEELMSEAAIGRLSRTDRDSHYSATNRHEDQQDEFAAHSPSQSLDSLEDTYGDYHQPSVHDQSAAPPQLPPYPSGLQAQAAPASNPFHDQYASQPEEDEMHSFDAPGYRPTGRGYYDQGLTSIGGETVPVPRQSPPQLPRNPYNY